MHVIQCPVETTMPIWLQMVVYLFHVMCDVWFIQVWFIERVSARGNLQCYSNWFTVGNGGSSFKESSIKSMQSCLPHHSRLVECRVNALSNCMWTEKPCHFDTSRCEGKHGDEMGPKFCMCGVVNTSVGRETVELWKFTCYLSWKKWWRDGGHTCFFQLYLGGRVTLGEGPPPPPPCPSLKKEKIPPPPGK